MISHPLEFHAVGGYTHVSCGVHQLHAFTEGGAASDLEYMMKYISSQSPHKRCAFYIFSDKNTVFRNIRDPNDPTRYKMEKDGRYVREEIASAEYGKHLAAYIIEQNLGTVLASEEGVNPNTYHKIQLWIWRVNHDALSAWCKSRGFENPNCNMTFVEQPA